MYENKYKAYMHMYTSQKSFHIHKQLKFTTKMGIVTALRIN